METNTLGGFEAILDTMLPGGNEKKETVDVKEDITEELTDEELQKLHNKEKEEEEEDLTSDKKDKEVKETKEDKEENEEEDTDDIDRRDTQDNSDNNNVDNLDERNIVGGFFDSLSEKLGWDDVEEDKKPQTAEDLVEYFTEVIEENSKPEYASEEMEQLDEFVRNGGSLRDYLSIGAEIDYDNIDIEDNEDAQKRVLNEFLREKGFSEKQASRKIEKYDDAGILEDEAEDALEALKDIKARKKELLLADQQKAAERALKQQQEFFNNVVSEIKGMDSIYGVKIPEKDKKVLLAYIFKPDADGITKYRKDYAKSLKNLIASAYFTMKGDDLVSVARKEGKRDAFTQFKNSLNKNSGISKKSKTQVINDDNSTIWSSFTKRLRNA